MSTRSGPTARADNRLGVVRLVAWIIDWVCILGWVGLTAAVGVPLHLAGLTGGLSYFQLNLIGALVVVVPVVLAAAVTESRPRAATPGKRLTGLRVSKGHGGPSVWAALVRNALKIGVPWLIGHAAVFALTMPGDTSGAVPPIVWLLTAFSYALPIAYVASLFLHTGRTPYDAATGTSVVRVPTHHGHATISSPTPPGPGKSPLRTRIVPE